MSSFIRVRRGFLPLGTSVDKYMKDREISAEIFILDTNPMTGRETPYDVFVIKTLFPSFRIYTQNISVFCFFEAPFIKRCLENTQKNLYFVFNFVRVFLEPTRGGRDWPPLVESKIYFILCRTQSLVHSLLIFIIGYCKKGKTPSICFSCAFVIVVFFILWLSRKSSHNPIYTIPYKYRTLERQKESKYKENCCDRNVSVKRCYILIEIYTYTR